jgi:hypothetical protein
LSLSAPRSSDTRFITFGNSFNDNLPELIGLGACEAMEGAKTSLRSFLWNQGKPAGLPYRNDEKKTREQFPIRAS